MFFDQKLLKIATEKKPKNPQQTKPTNQRKEKKFKKSTLNKQADKFGVHFFL